jgi:hypothetical protein
MPSQPLLQRAAAFVAQLHSLSVKSPNSWRRVDSVGRDVGLGGLQLQQAVVDRADDPGLILLTAQGRATAQ